MNLLVPLLVTAYCINQGVGEINHVDQNYVTTEINATKELQNSDDLQSCSYSLENNPYSSWYPYELDQFKLPKKKPQVKKESQKYQRGNYIANQYKKRSQMKNRKERNYRGR